MRAINALFSEAFEEPAAYLGSPPDDQYLERLLGRAEFIALLATEDDDVVGGLVAYELVKFEQARSEIYVYDLAVRADRRRQGAATALIGALKPIARSCGAWVIYVQADPPDAPAVALYDRLGTREEVLHFDIRPFDDRSAK